MVEPCAKKLLHSRTGVSNLSLVTGQKHTPQSMVGCTNFSPTIPFHLLFMLLLKLGNLCLISSTHDFQQDPVHQRYYILFE